MTIIIRSISATCTNSGCVNGACNAPDTCTCDNGWTGDDCNTACKKICIYLSFVCLNDS